MYCLQIEDSPYEVVYLSIPLTDVVNEHLDYEVEVV